MEDLLKPSEDAAGCKKAGVEMGECRELDAKLAVAMALLDPKQDSNVGTYAGALNAFRDAENTIKKENEDIKNKQEALETAKQSTIDAGTAIAGNVLEMAISEMTYQNNREQAQGRCYIYGGKNSGFYHFANQNQSKRISWNNF
jgi:uncharacterized membrane protein